MASSATAQSIITVAGGNLMALAAKFYGDASQWNRIAAANGLWDFIITGTATLIIPAPDPSAANGGILGI